MADAFLYEIGKTETGIRELKMSSLYRVTAICLAVAASTLPAHAGAEPYTPKPGSAERVAIMDAARLAQHTSVQFSVSYLSVLHNGTIAIAVADLNDAAGKVPHGGLMFFEAINGRWRAIFSIYMDGSDSCKMTVNISEALISKAKAMDAPPSFFPSRFFSGYKAALSDLTENGSDSNCSPASMY